MKALLVLFLGLILAFGCVVKQNADAPKVSSSGITEAPPPQLSGSVEQDNIKGRLEIVNKPSTTMWFYGLSDTGTIIFKSVVKGKVTSSGKRLEPAIKAYAGGDRYGEYYNPELLLADGTYGQSDEYVFWFDYEGNYFQWNGKYILSTKPLRIPSPLIEFQEITEAG